MTHEEYIQEIVRITDSVKEFGKGYFRENYDEDCVQEAVYICLKKYKDYDGTCAVKTWMIRIFINLQLQHFHKRRRLDGSGEIPDIIVGPVYGKHDYRYIVSKINKLRPTQRDAILRLIVGISIPETAKLIKTSAKYVKHINCASRNALRRLIADQSLLENHMPNERCAHHKQNINPAA